MGSRRAVSAVLVSVALLAAACVVALVTSSRSNPVGTSPAESKPVNRSFGQWIGTWATAPALARHLRCAQCTIRNVVHSSAGGPALRIRLSNAYGVGPLLVGHATAALPATPDSPAATPDTMRDVTFDGRPDVRIPAGGVVWSDPVRMTVPADHDLLVTTYLPSGRPTVDSHPVARQVSYLAGGTDAADDVGGVRFTRTTGHWYVLTGVDVRATGYQGALVTLGDSITDGVGSTAGANRRWPDLLADRLLSRPAGQRMSVLNVGIAGNRLLLGARTPGLGRRALTRLDPDVLDQTGVRTVFLLEGINDIQERPHQVHAARIIAGYRELIEDAHAHGLRIVGATLTPFGGWRVYNARLERVRETVNAWIRTSGTFDAVVDMDAAMRSPGDPHRLAPEYDSGDHLHPSDAGYAAMAGAVDIATLQPPA
ncbi:MAG: SGNH/GDSL hydrolase family protein [Actinocatenispora sp.]